MTAVLDTNVLLYLLNANTAPPIDPTTGQLLDRCAERVEMLIDSLKASKEVIVLPTPVLAEVLVRAQAAGPAYLDALEKTKHIRIVDFNKRAALEAAQMTAALLQAGVFPKGGDARAKLKFDTMIAAIAKISNANRIYSDDTGMAALGRRFNFEVIGMAALPAPPQPEPNLFSGLTGK